MLPFDYDEILAWAKRFVNVLYMNTLTNSLQLCYSSLVVVQFAEKQDRRMSYANPNEDMGRGIDGVGK